MRKFFTLLVSLLLGSTIVYAQVINTCPANRAIYKTKDGSKVFETTHFAMHRFMGCHNYEEKYSFRIPTVGYLQTPSPTYEEMDALDIDCRSFYDFFLKGMVDDEVVYVWSFNHASLPCCGNISYTEFEFNKRFLTSSDSEDPTFKRPKKFLWLQDDLVPDATDKLDTLTNWKDYNIHATEGTQPLGQDVYHLSGCSKDSFWESLLSKVWN